MGFTKSESNPQTQTSSAQITTTGASASQSPTINAGGGVTYEDAGGAVSLQALQGMQEVIQAALDNGQSTNQQALGLLADFNARQAQAQASQSNTDTSLLSSVLASNASLAQNTSTAGATPALNLTKYALWIVAGLGALWLWVSSRKKS